MKSTSRVINVYPMHGYWKMMAEGFRTRDGHVLEWLSMQSPHTVNVYSRPEPIGFRSFKTRRLVSSGPLPNTRDLGREVLRIPNPFDSKAWWVKSAQYYREPESEGPAIVWNPLAVLSSRLQRHWEAAGHPIHLDLLDDWTVHHAFKSISSQVDEAYSAIMRLATSVTANSEGTMDLARRYGREDAILLPNGCDPARFDGKNLAEGPVTIGYIGKIGKRLDTGLIAMVAEEFPNVRFVFAGPILEGEVGREIAKIKNVEMIGDQNYSRVPELLQKFDIGWVPHGVETGQVGGDAIKIYEYRAAGLPVVTTPIIGTRERPMHGVYVADSSEQIEVIRDLISGGTRVERVPSVLPRSVTWEFKTAKIAELIGISLKPSNA